MRRFKVGQRVMNPLTGREITIAKVVRNPPGTLGGSWIEYFDFVCNCPRAVTFDEFEDVYVRLADGRLPTRTRVREVQRFG